MHKILLVAAALTLVVTPAFADPEYVRVCDAFGPGFFYIPATETCVNVDTGETRTDIEPGVVLNGQTELAKQVQQANEGVALSIALPNATVDAGKTYGAAVNVGTFGGEAALGLGAAIKATEGLTFNGAVGVGLGGGNVAGRAGVNFSW
jgi:hypothetical protein